MSRPLSHPDSVGDDRFAAMTSFIPQGDRPWWVRRSASQARSITDSTSPQGACVGVLNVEMCSGRRTGTFVGPTPFFGIRKAGITNASPVSLVSHWGQEVMY